MKRILDHFRHFASDETGNGVVESVLILPVLAWWYVGTLVFYEGYEARNITLKATYTVSDMLSREDGVVNANYIEGMADIYEYLTDRVADYQAIRVTLLYCDDNCDKDDDSRVLAMDWSYGTDNKRDLTAGDLSDYLDKVPLATKGDRLILVESFSTFVPAFNVKLEETEFQTVVVNRPRFVPLLCFDGRTCEGS